MYATILQGVGIETRSFNNTLLALPLLFEFEPDLILMDMHMPGCNGMELANVTGKRDYILPDYRHDDMA